MAWKKDSWRHKFARFGIKSRLKVSVVIDNDGLVLALKVLKRMGVDYIDKPSDSYSKLDNRGEGIEKLKMEIARIGGYAPFLDMAFLLRLTDDKELHSLMTLNIIMLLNNDEFKERVGELKLTGDVHKPVSIDSKHETLRVLTTLVTIDGLNIDDKTKQRLKGMIYKMNPLWEDIYKGLKRLTGMIDEIEEKDTEGKYKVRELVTPLLFNYISIHKLQFLVTELAQLIDIENYKLERWDDEVVKHDEMIDILVNADDVFLDIVYDTDMAERIVNLLYILREMEERRDEIPSMIKDWKTLWETPDEKKDILLELNHFMLSKNSWNLYPNLELHINLRTIPTLLDVIFAMDDNITRKDQKLMEILGMEGRYIIKPGQERKVKNAENGEISLSEYISLAYISDEKDITDENLDTEERKKLIHDRKMKTLYDAIRDGEVDRAVKILKGITDKYNIVKGNVTKRDLRKYIKRTIIYRIHNTKKENMGKYIEQKDVISMYGAIPDRYTMEEKMMIITKLIGRDEMIQKAQDSVVDEIMKVYKKTGQKIERDEAEKGIRKLMKKELYDVRGIEREVEKLLKRVMPEDVDLNDKIRTAVTETLTPNAIKLYGENKLSEYEQKMIKYRTFRYLIEMIGCHVKIIETENLKSEKP